MTKSPKKLDTLVEDIYDLLQKKNKVNEDNLKQLGEEITSVVRERLETTREFKKPHIRGSNLGVKDRKLYYDMNVDAEGQEATKFQSSDLIKFMYGDIIEALLLFFIKEAGHEVTGEQGEIEIDGVIGHRDCIIDGITTDIKSTSNFAFTKFEKGTLAEDDPFGYIAQISTYCYADKSPYGAFLAMNKENGKLALLKVDPMDMIDPPARIKHVRAMIKQPEPPTEKCYPEIPHGKSGNMTIGKGCGWCPHKFKCWEDANNGQGLRSFRYSMGVKHFTTVPDTPRVEELTFMGKSSTDKNDK